MKKYIIIGIGSFALVLIIGLGAYFGLQLLNKNTLYCSSNNDVNRVVIEQNYVIKFDNDVVNNVTATKKYTYEDQARFDTFSNIVAKGNDANMASLKNNNIDFNSNINGKTYSTTLKVNVKDANKENLSKIGLDKSLKVVNENLKTQGLVCK